MLIKLSIILLSLTICACATKSTNSISATQVIIDDLGIIGKNGNINHVVKAIGKPNDVDRIDNKQILHSWMVNTYINLYNIGSNSILGQILDGLTMSNPYYKPQPIPQPAICHVYITTDNDGNILNYSAKGNELGCSIYALRLEQYLSLEKMKQEEAEKLKIK